MICLTSCLDSASQSYSLGISTFTVYNKSTYHFREESVHQEWRSVHQEWRSLNQQARKKNVLGMQQQG